MKKEEEAVNFKNHSYLNTINILIRNQISINDKIHKLTYCYI